jgi:hypothetical protein
MARDSSQVLGAPQLAGAAVMHRGHAWQQGVHGPGVVGVAGATIGYAASKLIKDTSQTPQFRRTAFLAVNDREVALLRLGTGGFKNGTLGEVIARVPRSYVASANVSAGVLRTNLTISFTDGGRWEFEVSPLIRRTVVRVARALGY